MSLRMYEQLRALWQTRDKEQPFIRGYLKTKVRMRGYRNGTTEPGPTVTERWFTLLGHSLFYCAQKDTPEFNGALLTDVFSPVIARVDSVRFDSFHAENTQQANSLYLEGVSVQDMDVLLCPSSAEEKRMWLEILQQAGLKVPARKTMKSSSAGKDARKQVVIVDDDDNDFLYPSPSQRVSGKEHPYLLHHPAEDSMMSLDSHKFWKHQWQVVAKRVLSLPDAAQVRMKYEILGRFVVSEERYTSDLQTLVEGYYRPIRLAIASGHVSISWTTLDSLFLNCESLLTLHKLLLSQMKASIHLPSPNFGEIFHHFIPHMSLYVDYIKSQGLNTKILDECLVNPSLTDYLENHHSSHDCEAQHLRMLLQQPLGRFEIYQAFIEEVLKQTNENHCDYVSLGTALQELEDLKMSLTSLTGTYEKEEQKLRIVSSVGPRGLILLEPSCTLILEDDTLLPASSKWASGTIKQRKVHCYLYSIALIVISKDKKVKNQLLPLNGATVYENVSRTGNVTYSKDSELEAKALKLYSPDGPRNGVVIIFFTQSAKSMWLLKICEMISHSTPGDHSPTPPPSGGSTSPTSTPTTPPPLLTVDTPPLHMAATPPSQLSPFPRRSSLASALPSRETAHLASDSIAIKQMSSKATHTHSPRRIHFHPSLSNSTTSLVSVGSNESNDTFGSVVDVFKLSRSHPSTQCDVITRSHSMFSVTGAESAPLVTRAVQDCYSVPSLFSMLVSSPPSPRYPATFLLTYRMFTNAHEVLDVLIDEHRRGLNERTRLGAAFAVPTESLRFFNVLKVWINKYYVDFHHDVNLKQMLMVYLSSIKEHECLHSKERELVDNLLKTVNTRGYIPLIRKSKLKIQAPKALRSVPDSLLSIPAEQLAKQLTWLEHEIYSRIKPYEFLQQKWTKKNRLELAPNICYVISRFNEVSLWLGKEILSPEHPRKRCAVVQYLIEVAKHCLELGNFVSVFQITSTLYSSAIQRLKKTWDHLPHLMLETLQALKVLTSVEGGSKVYRLKQKSSPSPSVPYIGPYLNLLVSIEVGMSTFVKHPPEHVNFLKLTKLASVIEEVTRFQNPKYSIPADGAILAFLDEQVESSREFDEEQRYSRSVAVEPKKERSRKKSISNLLSGD